MIRGAHAWSAGVAARVLAAVLVACVQSGFAGKLDSANALYTAGKLPAAIAAYKVAVRAGENPALCYYNAANAYYQLDSLAQAVVSYRACLRHARDFVKARLNLAVTYYALDDMGACIAALREVVRSEPAHDKAWLILGTAYRRTGAIAQAAGAFERLVELKPSSEEPYLALGEMYRELGDPATAVRWLLSYPQDGSSATYVFTALSELYESMGDLARALYYTQMAYEADRSRKWSVYRIVSLNERLGNDLVALELARDAMRQFPDFAEIALAAGAIAFRQGRFDQAQVCYEHAARLGSAGAVVGLQNVRQTLKQDQ